MWQTRSCLIEDGALGKKTDHRFGINRYVANSLAPNLVIEDGTAGEKKTKNDSVTAILECVKAKLHQIPTSPAPSDVPNETKRTVQVYNENIRDLLNDTGDFLDLREDPIKVRRSSRPRPAALFKRGCWLSLMSRGIILYNYTKATPVVFWV